MTASPASLVIARDDPARNDVRLLLQEHLDDMHAISPAESVHALEVGALAADDVEFWTARDGEGHLLGCGALTRLELKSMRTAKSARGRGVAAAVLLALIRVARDRGDRSLWLETGSDEYFAAARRLYTRHGFVECGPFGAYRPDRNSVFMTRSLDDGLGTP